MTVSLEVPDEVTNMLNALWDQLGVDINDRNQSLISIRSDLAAFVLKYVENEKRRVNDICEEINAVNNRITVAYDVLGIPRKEVAQTSSNLGLLQVLHLSKSEESQVAEKCKAMSDVIGHNLQQIQNVYCELGMEIPEEFSTVGDVDLSSGRLAYVEAALEQANQEKSLREAKLGKLIVGIDELTVQLDQSRLDTFSITTDSLGKCEAYLRSLQDAMELNRRELNEVGKHVADLWALLKSDQDHILRFKQLLRGTLATDLRMYKKELENLSKIYEESLPILARNALERIANLQIELRMLPSVGSQPRELGKITTETIKILEKEEADLMVQLEKSRCLLQLVGKWETSRSEMIQGQLEAKAYANDPNRFHGRQAFKMLKKEEDVRRLESKILPRLQEKLCTAIQTWERDQGHPFLVDNTPFLQTINSLIQSDKENSLLFSPSRTASPALGTKSITTPSPVVSRRHSISSLKKTPESSSKRGGVESAIKPQRLRMGSFEDKPCLPPRVPITDHFVAKALEQADAALATAASTESSSRQALTSMTQAIKELEATGPNSAVTNSDALCDLYHKRSVVYTALGEYDAALNDSEAALTHGHRNYSL